MEPSKVKHPTVMDPMELSLGEVYAQALLESLPDNTQADSIAGELEELLGLIDSIPEARVLLSGYAMHMEQRAGLIKRIFSGRVSERVEALLGVLNRRNRMNILGSVVRSFRNMLNKREGKIEVMLTTASPLDASQQLAIEQELNASLKKKTMLRLDVNEKLLGGAVLRVGDRVYDASLRAKLAKMAQQMAARRTSLKSEDVS